MKIIKEHSGFRRRWDITIFLLIILGTLIIPYQIAFQHHYTTFSSIIIYCIDLFFFVDILLNFRTAYRKAGREITSRADLSRHYLKSGFGLDLVSTIPFDALFLLIPGLEWEGISLVLWFRLLRLVRINRMFIIIKRWQNQSWINPGYLRLGMFALIMVILSHLIACSWYLFAYMAGFPSESWIVAEGIHDGEMISRYIRSLYWTVTTMTTVGYGDITPHLDYEYLFVIVVMVVGAFMYAYIIGNIASLVSNLDAQKSSYRNKTDTIKLYLKRRGVPDFLNERVRNYYEYVWAHHRGFDRNMFLNDLPAPLRLDVMLHLTEELLENVPLFKYSSEGLKHILLMSLNANTFDPDSIIVRAGEKGNAIFFISKGSIGIFDANRQKRYCDLKSGDYFGDLSIITGENRTATAITNGFCEIFVLYAEDFRRIKEEYPEFREVLKKISSDKSDKTAKMILEGIIL